METTLFATFLEGILSFLSPCVLPMLPLYMSYLAGDNKTIGEDGKVIYKTFKVFLATLFFVLGICVPLVLLAVSTGSIADFLDNYSEVISIIGGVLLIIFGLHEIGLINIDVLNFEARFKLSISFEKNSLVRAFLLGLVFALGWSPCIGPMLSNALLLAATSSEGYLYIIAYGLGLIIPFLITGLLTSKVLNFFNQRKNIVKWVMKISGIILLCFGLYMIDNAAIKIDNYKNINKQDSIMEHEFYDQDGKKLMLSDFNGKYVMLDFSTTWCTYCKTEIPAYLEFSKENDDIVCLYVMSSSTSNLSKDDLIEYIDTNLDLRVIVDEDNYLFSSFGIRSYPTKYVLSPDGEILGYISSSLSLDGYRNVLEEAKRIYKESKQN